MPAVTLLGETGGVGSGRGRLKPVPGASLRTALKIATGPAHGRLHHNRLLTALRHGSLAHGDYTDLMLRLLGLQGPIDEGLAAHRNTPSLAWYPAGYGNGAAERLADDLMRLGVDAQQVMASPTACHLLPPLDDPLAALGCAWVVEGSAIGRQVPRHVAAILGPLYPHGASFFQLDAQQPARWATCCAALDQCETHPARQQAILATAAQTFDAFEIWLEALS